MVITAQEVVRQAVTENTAWHLRLDKFSFCVPAASGGDPDFLGVRPAAEKKKALAKVIESYRQSLPCLEEECARRQQWLEAVHHLHGSRYREVRLGAASRLLIHLGRASVLENVGICAERISGLPWIPGTGVKGLLSTWASWEENFDPKSQSDPDAEPFPLAIRFVVTRTKFQQDLAVRILGKNSDPDDRAAESGGGALVFLGGYALTPPRMTLDIVNPHHKPTGAPQAPIPSYFLALSPGTNWVFPFYALPGIRQPDKLLDSVERWLKEALTQIGIGGKTAADYGRFGPPLALAYKSPSPDDTVPPPPPPPPPLTYEEFLAKTKDWGALAGNTDRLANLSPLELEYTKRFFATEAGQALLNSWGGLGGMQRKANLRRAGVLEDEE